MNVIMAVVAVLGLNLGGALVGLTEPTFGENLILFFVIMFGTRD